MDKELFYQAKEAAKMAYSPYSNYKVGAALKSVDDKVYLGCNIENASYGLTICAERVAVGNAVVNGAKKYKAIAIYVASETLFPPCGACRQVLAEFSINMEVIYGNDTEVKSALLSELLPASFNLESK